MKINSKIILLLSVCLIFVSVVIGLMALWQLNRTGKMAIAQIEKIETANINKIEADGKNQLQDFRENILLLKKEHLKSQVQTAMSALKKALDDALSMDMSGLDQAAHSAEVKEAIMMEQKENISKFIGTLRYGPENKDYFWINDMHPRMIMHPYKPQLNGKDLSGSKDPNGKRLFVEFVKVCREKGEGFVDYYWPKYGSDNPQPKLSFVKLFKEWNWIIGTGTYIDDIDSLVQTKKAELEKKIQAATAEMEHQIEITKTEIHGTIRQVILLIGITTLILLAMALTASLIFAKQSITKPLNRIIEGLNDGAEQVASASGQVSSASQSLAEGASEQAASIEETSSSLEEMSSMTKQNADNASQADTLMKETNQVVSQANASMGELTQSMEEISKANDETQKIIKTIDEIAFQTNLLALNAAVEAARAGEAGAGFAVVAEEVRNLAMRSAEAARNTAEMIEGTVKKTKNGSEIVTRTNDAFVKVYESSAKVGELVGEIAAASNEQAQGIEQVNIAVTQMDHVTQQNAANAEESASASEEMSAQAEHIKDMVNELVAMVGGNTGEVGSKQYAVSSKSNGASKIHNALAAPAKKGKEVAVAKANEVSPDEVISMDNADFKDF